jgi:hypothetical protein
VGRRLALVALVALGCALAIAPREARATTCTIPYVFTNGTTINAAPFNSNFTALQTCGNNIDNTNIGSAGIYASQVIPLTAAEATFGGALGYTFPNSVTTPTLDFSGGSTTPYIQQDSGTQTGLLFVEPAASPSFGYRFFVNNTGTQVAAFNTSAASVAGSFTAGTSLIETTSYGPGYNDALIFNSGTGTGTTRIGASSGPALNGIASSALYINNGQSTSLLTLDASGDLAIGGGLYATGIIEGVRSGGGVLTPVAPVYTNAGAAIASTVHSVFGSCTTSASNTCAVSFSGAATFTSAATFACSVSTQSNFVEYSQNNGGGTSVLLGLSGASAGTYTMNAICTGY